MATRNTEPQDLGRLAALDESRLDAEVVLWGRFGVVGPRREYDRGIAVAVEDLDRKLGDPPGHRAELHLLDLPADRARFKRACSIDSRVQPHVYATAEAGGKLALLCEPAAGNSIASPLALTGTDSDVVGTATLDRTQLLTIAIDLAGLLTKLHAASVHGVRFNARQLRIDDAQFSLDGFAHLVGDPATPERDVESLFELLRTLGGSSVAAEFAESAGAKFTTTREVWEHLKSVRKAESSPVEFELPTELPFVGRLSALATLAAGISEAHIAKPTVIVVQGDRGVGKSRLLREFVALHLDSKELLVLTGAGQVQSGDTGSGLIGALEQLSTVMSRLDPDERDDIRLRIDGATKHLGAILIRSAPALGSVLRHAEELPQLELGGDFSRHTAVIADVFKALGTRQRPLLLVLDNVEALDANSAAVLDIIAQSRPAHYTLVVLGLRTGASGYRPEFEREQVGLKPLDVEEVAELLSRTLAGGIADLPALAQLLWSATKGLPLSLGATLRAWTAGGRLARGADGIWRARKSLRDAIDEQPSVRDLVGARFANADARVRKFALDCAVLGIEVRSELLVEFTDDVDSAVHDLCDRGIVIRTESGIRFSHDTIRELVLDSVPEPERRIAHQRVGNILTRRNAPIAQIVYHRDLGFDADVSTREESNKLSRLHVEAGRDRLDVYDLERARWHLERALEHSQAPEQRGLAAEGLADICLLQEDIDTAVALYTAIIATASPVEAVRVAAKATQFLYGKNANADARELGNMALEMAGEAIPTSTLGKLRVIFTSLVRSWFGECKLDSQLRDGLCRLYNNMLYASIIDDPVAVPMYAARGRWVAIGLETGAAAVIRSLEAAFSTVLGFFKHADEVFAIANRIAQNSKDAWAQGMVFHHWGGALLALARYSDGQDRLDDGVAAFRETGDISIALISIHYKGVYGRDREHADKVLGWIEAGLTTARRHGKRSAVLTLQSLKLHVLARQGRSDLEEQLLAQAAATASGDVPGMERLASNIELAYAYLELGDLDRALEHVTTAQKDAKDLGGIVPEFCQEVHLVAALVLIARPMRTRAEQKQLKLAVRKFRGVLKQAPRLRVLGDMLDMKLALEVGKVAAAQHFASKIVSDFDTHENLNAARQAHRVLARLLKGENVLASAQHEGLARNLGRRLGLLDHVLLSDFSEIGREVGLFVLTEENSPNLLESQHELPAAAMLSASSSESPAQPPKESAYDDGEADVLEAWAIGDLLTPRVSLGSILTPVRAAVSSSIAEQNLEIVCDAPELEVPFASADVQILLINMLLACRDAIGSKITVSARLDEVLITDFDEVRQKRLPEPGRYLSIHVSARGSGNHSPVIGSFAACESDAQALGGVLSASTERGRVSLQVYLRLTAAPVVPAHISATRVLIIHPDRSLRRTIGAGLDDLGVSWEDFEPEDFVPGTLEHVAVIFAENSKLNELRVLQPLSTVKLVEIIRRGNEPLNPQYDTLRVPFSISELEKWLHLATNEDFE
jgi:tetratricopeptide (TPR) repeat protein